MGKERPDRRGLCPKAGGKADRGIKVWVTEGSNPRVTKMGNGSFRVLFLLTVADVV